MLTIPAYLQEEALIQADGSLMSSWVAFGRKEREASRVMTISAHLEEGTSVKPSESLMSFSVFGLCGEHMVARRVMANPVYVQEVLSVQTDESLMSCSTFGVGREDEAEVGW